MRKTQDKINPYGNHSERILEFPAFHYSIYFAQKYDCDIAVLNGEGIGNIVIYTRLVEELALKKGSPLRILTAPINPKVGIVGNEEEYPIWKNNPFVDNIVNADKIDKKIMMLVNQEQDNFCQFNHMIENICSIFGLKPRELKPSLYLSFEEMKWAIKTLSHLQRPIICLHPSGKSSVFEDSPWYYDNWVKLINQFSNNISFIQIGKFDYDDKELPTFKLKTTLREAMSLIWASDIFIGFDSGPSHIATAFDKPSLILWNVLRKNPIEEPMQTGFGPASLLRWSYPQNRNLMLLGEKDNEIYNLIVEFIIEKLYSFNRHYKFSSFPVH